MTEERKQELARKVQFVKAVDKAIIGNIYNIESVKYEVYEHISHDWTQEWIVITFKGGAISVRNCNGTSCSGILRAIAQNLDGGYYDEVPYYEECQEAKSDFSLMEF